MPHKFVPRKGLNRKTEPEAEQSPPEPAPLEDSGEEAPAPPPRESILKGRLSKDSILKKLPGRKSGPLEVDPPAPEGSPEESPPPAKESILSKGRSAKDSILKKLPSRGGPRSRPRFDPNKREPAARSRPAAQGGLPKGVLFVACLGAFLLVGGSVAFFVMNQVPGYRSGLAVTAATRLDWTVVDGKKSLTETPTLMAMYESKNQRYDLYVPADLDPAVPAPVVLFISHEARPAGWGAWQNVCVKEKAIFAAPHGAGDERSFPERVRIALDVLDEVRRSQKTDPDRTYIVGFASGGRVASRIAFALPELFGGVVGFSGADLLRDEPWLRQRVSDRLSVAWTYGQATDPTRLDPAKPEVERLFKPFFDKLKVRCNASPQENQGKSMPAEDVVEAIFKWLDEPAAREHRGEFAKKYPASRMPGDVAWTRAEAAKALFDEAKDRVAPANWGTDTFFTGAAELKGVDQRWEDLPVAKMAERQYQELYQQDSSKPWLMEDFRRRRTQDLALARALTDFLMKTPEEALDLSRSAANWERHQGQFDKAIALWQLIINQGGDPEEQAEAKKNKAELQRKKVESATGSTGKDKDKKAAE